MEISKHWLKESANEKIVKNSVPASKLKKKQITPRWLVIHYTAMNSALDVVNLFKKTSSVGGAHIVLAKDGTITQMFPFNSPANHAGYSSWDGDNLFNGFSIGIELDNPGFAEKIADGSYFRKQDKQSWPASSPMSKIDHKHSFQPGKQKTYWHQYPDAQLEALYKLAKLLVDTYNLKVIGHDDISAGRKTDPGPAFPWDLFKTKVLGKADNTGKIYRTNKATELKEGPSATAKLIKKLPDKYEVGLITTEGEWSKVYLTNKVPDVKTIANGTERSIKTNGWVLTSALKLKEGQ